MRVPEIVSDILEKLGHSPHAKKGHVTACGLRLPRRVIIAGPQLGLHCSPPAGALAYFFLLNTFVV